ncbi:MAG: DJ-1/PfpI family protein [Pikeienuella sp.]
MARRLYALVFDGFEMLDLYGPLEMLQDVAEIALVAEGSEAVRASGGPRALPETKLADINPGAEDILLIPGGPGTRALVDHPPLIEAIGRLSEMVGLSVTVCTGAALLARTGHLDGRKATSNKRAFDWVRLQGPRVDWQPSARWVEDGAFLTSSGVAAGMDMALALRARLTDRADAEARAQRIEYRWVPDPNDDPFAVA